jgi:hypothetical protein
MADISVIQKGETKMKTTEKIKMISLRAFAIAAAFVWIVGPALADTTVNFDDPLPANVSFQAYNDSGSAPPTSAGLSSDYAHSGTQSARLYLGDVNQDEARVKITGVGGTLGTTSASYWAYEPVGVSGNTPYLMLLVDTNNSGAMEWAGSNDSGPAYDSYIITSPTNPLIPGQWVQETLTADTLVHVFGNRDAFGVESDPGSKYSAWNGFGRFGDLLNETYGSYTWGSMSVFNAYVDHSWTPATPVYVDDINIATVPEPGTITLLVLGGLTTLATMRIRRVRSRQK